MNLSQCSVAYDDIDTYPLVLLVICEIVFDGGDDASGLYAIDVRARELASDIRVLGHRFKSSSTQGRSLDTDGGTWASNVLPLRYTLHRAIARLGRVASCPRYLQGQFRRLDMLPAHHLRTSFLEHHSDRQ